MRCWKSAASDGGSFSSETNVQRTIGPPSGAVEPSAGKHLYCNNLTVMGRGLETLTLSLIGQERLV